MGSICEEYVNAYIQRYHWQLIGRDELLRLTQDALEHSGNWSGAAIRAAILCIYSVKLYEACSDNVDRERWEQGYIELHDLLDNVARHRYPQVHADATQRALLLCPNSGTLPARPASTARCLAAHRRGARLHRDFQHTGHDC